MSPDAIAVAVLFFLLILAFAIPMLGDAIALLFTPHETNNYMGEDE